MVVSEYLRRELVLPRGFEALAEWLLLISALGAAGYSSSLVLLFSFPLTRLVTTLRTKTASRFSSRPGKPHDNREIVLMARWHCALWQEELFSGAMT